MKKPINRIPNLVNTFDNMTDPAEWAVKREEYKCFFAEHVYGEIPEGSEDGFKYTVEYEKNCRGITIRKVRVSKEWFSVDVYLYYPEGKTGVPFIIHPELKFYAKDFDPERPYHFTRKPSVTSFPVSYIVKHGIGFAIFQVQKVEPDEKVPEFTDLGKLLITDRNGTSAGTLRLWAFLGSRVADYLLESGLADPTKIGVAGHSRGGKAALAAGAFDERFSFVWASNAGCTGDSLACQKTGERIEDIVDKFPYWFCPNYAEFVGKDDNLPFDFHQLTALIAPRLLYVTGSTRDDWADPVNQYRSALESSLAYQNIYHMAGMVADNPPKINRFYHEGTIGYHLKRGKHSMAWFDWKGAVKFLKKKGW